MVLAGIGGATVEEAQARMSHAEFVDWITYANRHGGFNVGLRMEDGFAMLASVIAQTNGKRYSADHFKPKREQAQEEFDISKVFSMLQGKARETQSAKVKRHGK